MAGDLRTFRNLERQPFERLPAETTWFLCPHVGFKGNLCHEWTYFLILFQGLQQIGGERAFLNASFGQKENRGKTKAILRVRVPKFGHFQVFTTSRGVTGFPKSKVDESVVFIDAPIATSGNPKREMAFGTLCQSPGARDRKLGTFSKLGGTPTKPPPSSKRRALSALGKPQRHKSCSHPKTKPPESFLASRG